MLQNTTGRLPRVIDGRPELPDRRFGRIHFGRRDICCGWRPIRRLAYNCRKPGLDRVLSDLDDSVGEIQIGTSSQATPTPRSAPNLKDGCSLATLKIIPLNCPVRRSSKLGRPVCQLSKISFPRHKNMRDVFQSAGLIERTGQDAHAGLGIGLPEQAGSTFAAKPAPGPVGTGVPFQTAAFGDGDVSLRCFGVCPAGPVQFLAHAAMAGHHIPQRAVHVIADSPAETAAAVLHLIISHLGKGS